MLATRDGERKRERERGREKGEADSSNCCIISCNDTFIVSPAVSFLSRCPRVREGCERPLPVNARAETL